MLATGSSSGASSSVMPPGDIGASAMAALGKSPKKGILKKHGEVSIEEQSVSPRTSSAGLEKSARWDEMNILQTYHPPDKDYGHMKIDEPKTPYYTGDDEAAAVAPEDIERRLRDEQRSALVQSHQHGSHVSLSSEDDTEDLEETPEQRAHRETFELRRKAHYNEGLLLKQAKKMVEQELERLDHEDFSPPAGEPMDAAASAPVAQEEDADEEDDDEGIEEQREACAHEPCQGKVTSSYQGPSSGAAPTHHHHHYKKHY